MKQSRRRLRLLLSLKSTKKRLTSRRRQLKQNRMTLTSLNLKLCLMSFMAKGTLLVAQRKPLLRRLQVPPIPRMTMISVTTNLKHCSTSSTVKVNLVVHKSHLLSRPRRQRWILLLMKKILAMMNLKRCLINCMAKAKAQQVKKTKAQRPAQHRPPQRRLLQLKVRHPSLKIKTARAIRASRKHRVSPPHRLVLLLNILNHKRKHQPLRLSGMKSAPHLRRQKRLCVLILNA